ncbi:hypothetical protein CMV_027176 [Castanea mollissima]|uniref:Uncharacterized protein n=1 Tax=Castanea mollissima TaxID=60419 RepID=A0A8J4VF80_9ROSI|nr:hypothetical protein CMV_027176 [Castanea mollissima]
MESRDQEMLDLCLGERNEHNVLLSFRGEDTRFNFTDHLYDRAALTKVANLRGWYLKDNSESEVITKIIQIINSELDREVPSVSEHLVGMESCDQEMLDLCLGESFSPRGKLRRSISSWQKGVRLGSGAFGTVYEGYTE